MIEFSSPLTIFLLIGLITWSIFLYFSYKGYKFLPPLDAFKSPQFSPTLLSIVIAVKDEQESITHTINTLCKVERINFELIVINDRSTDKTGIFIEKIAQENPKVKYKHIQELPDGWLGKVHALYQGHLLSQGEYILFMDGDVEVTEKVLSQSLSLMQHKALDHLTIMPHIPCPTFFLKLLVSTSQLLFTLSARTWLSIEKRPLKCVKGIGPFNMVRKKTLDQSEGLQWLKLDISDDVALSHLIAKDGGRSLYIRVSEEGPRFPWYKDAIHMMKGLEKNIVGGFTNYSLLNLFIVASMASLPLITPILAFILFTPTSIALGLLSLGLNLVFALKVTQYQDHGIFPLFLYPLGIFLINLIMIRAAFLCFTQGGIYWSGTFYPLTDLKKGIRVKLGI